MKPQFKYYLKDPAGGYYFATESGGVGISTEPRPLTYSPLEWDKVAVKLERNSKAHGVFRATSLPFTFVLDGAACVRAINYGQGYEGKGTFEIEQLNTTTQLYEPFYSGSLNCLTLQDDLDTVAVELEDNALAAQLKAGEDTPFEIPILDVDSEVVLLDGIRLRNTVSYSALSIMVQGSTDARTSNPELVRNSSESDIIVDALAHVDFDTNTLDSISQNRPFYICSTQPGTVDVTFKGTYTSNYSQGSYIPGDELRVTVLRRRGTALLGFSLYSDPVTPNGGFKVHNIDGAVSIPILPGDKLSLAVWVGPAGGGLAARYTLNCTNGVMTVSYDFKLGPSNVRGYRYIDVIQKVLSKISPGATVVSDYLNSRTLYDYDTKPYNAILTCGNAIRRLGNGAVAKEAAAIKTSFDKIRQDLLGRFGCGYSVEGNSIRIEPLAYFYNPAIETVADLGEIDNLTVSYNEEYLGKNFEFGQKSEDYKDLPGREEPNTTQTYSNLPAVRVSDTLNYKYIFRSDTYGIEFLRHSDKPADTIDNESDNDTFCIEVGDGLNNKGERILFRPQNDPAGFITGSIAAETAYNLGYSPKRCLYRLRGLVAVSFWKQPNAVLTFQTTDKNPRLESRLGGNPMLVKESADVAVSDLGTPLFLPLDSQFDTVTPLRLSVYVAARPLGLVKWRNRKVLQWGFIDDIGEIPEGGSTYKFKIMMAPGSPVSAGNYPS